MSLYTSKIKAEIFLQRKLEKAYSKRDYKNIEVIIKNFMYNNLYDFLKIKNKYLAFNLCFNYLYKIFEKNYLASLVKINTNNLLTRAKLDANLIINSPANILDGIHSYYNIKLRSNKNFTNISEEDNYSLFLYWAVDSAKSYDLKVIEQINEDLLNEINNTNEESKKRELKQQLFDIKELNQAIITANIIAYFANDKWNSQFLPTSRPAHISAHGQLRGKSGYFEVGGEKLSYPGDFENGSIGNVINCRCFLTR